MSNYKIKRNPSSLTDEQINRHKDFNKLLGNHQKLHRFQDARKPLYKNIGFMSLMILIGIVLLMLVIDHSEEQNTSAKTEDSLATVKANNEAGIKKNQNEKK